MQVKLVLGTDYQDLQDSLNRFLDSLSDNEPRIKYNLDKMVAIVEYESVRKKALCCECQHWADEGGLVAFCTMCGKRKRYDGKPCNHYLDVRG